MALEISNVKKVLQDHLQEGLLLVVGTGTSIAEGVPGMSCLAKKLKDTIPSRLQSEPDSAWAEIVEALDKGDNLEFAMSKVNLKETTVDAIVAVTAEMISEAERKVISQVFGKAKILPFTVFLKHLFKAAKQFHLITPNYDRLIELAAEVAEIGVDCRFSGYLFGHLDPRRSADAHRESYTSGKVAGFRPLRTLCVHKPHGSLDWFDVDGKIVRCPVAMNKTPMIITPGIGKYRESFKWAFDDQRTSGNRAVNNSTRFMFIGYGFNDDHLEQCLCPGYRLTKPSVIITKELSANALRVIQTSSTTNVLALTAVSPDDRRTRIISSSGEELIVDEELWNLNGFNEGVL